MLLVSEIRAIAADDLWLSGASGRPTLALHFTWRHLRHASITAASFDAGVPLRDVQEAASRADPRTTMRYHRARTSLDRHATHIVATYAAGAAW